MKRNFKVALTALLAVAAALPLLPAQARPWTLFLAPKPPKYPDPVPRAEVTRQAQLISDRLENHIKAWMDGKASARIPKELIPQGNDFANFSTFTLVRPEEQWVTRAAHEIDLNKVIGQFPDPHCTYLVLPMLAPLARA